MADSITIARPYAKAIFEHALAEGCLPAWSLYLQAFKNFLLDQRLVDFIQNPASTTEQRAELFLSLFGDLSSRAAQPFGANISKEPRRSNPSSEGEAPYLSNFVRMLAEAGRLILLPEISDLFQAMRAEHEKTLEVTVSSYAELSKNQQEALGQALSKRLQREVRLNIVIDKDKAIGGATITAGDLVIDGSVRGQLAKLRSTLTA